MIDLIADEFAAVASAVRRAISEDRYPRAPWLEPLKSALDKLDPRPGELAVARPPLPSASRTKARR